MTRVGRWTCSMVQAMVALLPLPVMPSRVWNRSPRMTPSDSAWMALGWSPAGPKSLRTLKSGIRTRSYRGPVTVPTGLPPGAARSVELGPQEGDGGRQGPARAVSYTHLRAHETGRNLV